MLTFCFAPTLEDRGRTPDGRDLVRGRGRGLCSFSSRTCSGSGEFGSKTGATEPRFKPKSTCACGRATRPLGSGVRGRRRGDVKSKSSYAPPSSDRVGGPRSERDLKVRFSERNVVDSGEGKSSVSRVPRRLQWTRVTLCGAGTPVLQRGQPGLVPSAADLPHASPPRLSGSVTSALTLLRRAAWRRLVPELKTQTFLPKSVVGDAAVHKASCPSRTSILPPTPVTLRAGSQTPISHSK